jgi:hypothetical protein
MRSRQRLVTIPRLVVLVGLRATRHLAFGGTDSKPW